ncbi:hypothetical protein L218DRAFT_804519, partial [Marasmius fiardii PR-910]
TINLDGKSAIQALAQRSPTAGQYLLEAIHSMTAHCLCPKITFQWIPGHEGIEGNKEADTRAKRAADGDSSNPNKLPELLRTPLPCSLSMSCKVFNQDVKTEWESRFQLSPRHLRMFPPHSINRLNYPNSVLIGLPRQWCSLIVQLQSGHIALNAHLFRIRKTTSPDCDNC